MGGMTIATWTNEDLTEKEDEHVCVCPRRPQGGCEERTKVKGEGRSERSRSKSRHLLTPTLLSLGYHLEGIITNSFPPR